jgi:hypothetical protein
MPEQQWHPYIPDQAFGTQAVRDEELLDAVVAHLEKQRAQPPRAANRAASGSNRDATIVKWRPRVDQFRWAIGEGTGLPITTAVGLEAASRLREDQDG